MTKGSWLRWGIIGLGNIAHKFTSDLLLSDHHIIQSVASRDQDKAETFKTQYNALSSYGSYEELLKDPLVDIVYIATPHNSHCDIAISAMENNKAVLVEKPIGVNERQAKSMIKKSQEKNLFLMEALWTRFNPVIIDIFDKVKSGIIGEITEINASFCLGFSIDYNLSYLMTESGADASNTMTIHYKNAKATIESSITYHKPIVAEIIGNKGRITIEEPWYKTRSYNLQLLGEKEINYTKESKAIGYLHEAEECHRVISKGLIESPLWSHHDSLSLIQFMDNVRERMGLKYPFE